MSKAPRRIDQLIPSIIEHDAVSNHTFIAQRLLRELGFESDIYAATLGPGTSGRVREIREFEPDDNRDHWLCYQCSIGSSVAEIFRSHGGPKLLDYHNITPSELVERWLPPLADEVRLGRRQLKSLAPIVDFALADSRFNADELSGYGYRHVEVVPVLIAPRTIQGRLDGRVLELYRDRKGHHWLFVGQIAPHKAQHDVILAFSRYRELYDRDAQLHLVGREMGSAYLDALRRLVRALQLEDSVHLPGSVSQEELASYYEIADVFVCLSDHEGFCAPIAEAMSRGIPVVAYAVAAVPSTLGNAGVLLSSKEADFVAAVVQELFSSREAVDELRLRGPRRAETFSLDNAEQAFRSSLKMAIDLLG